MDETTAFGKANRSSQEITKGTGSSQPVRSASDITKDAMDSARNTPSEPSSDYQELLELGKDVTEPELQEDPRKKTTTRRSITERVKSGYSSTKTKIREIKTKYPKATKAVGMVAKTASWSPPGRITKTAWTVLRSVDAEDIKKAKELAVEWGKDIRVFIDDAKQKLAKEEKAAKGEPFYQRQEAERQKTINRLELKRKWLSHTNKGEYIHNVGEVRFSNGEAIRDTLDKIDAVKKAPPSLEEAISRQASLTPIKANPERVITNADELGKRYLAGSPGAKYDYYLHNTIHHLGRDYFDLAKHPQRAIEFDRFAATRLYQDGFKPKDVENAVKGGTFRSSLGHSLDSKLLREYDQKTIHSSINNQQVNHIREKTQRWQHIQGGNIKIGNINPQEVDQHHALKSHWQMVNLKKAQTTKYQALDKLAEYNQAGEKLNDQSTDAQYLLEYGKWLAKGRTPDEQVITTRLTIAGHSQEEVMEVLRQRSIRFNESSQYLKEEYKTIEETIAKNEKYFQEYKETQKIKSDNSVKQNERRLESLQLSYEHREGAYQTTRHVMESQRNSSPPPTKNKEISPSSEIEP